MMKIEQQLFIEKLKRSLYRKVQLERIYIQEWLKGFIH